MNARQAFHYVSLASAGLSVLFFLTGHETQACWFMEFGIFSQVVSQAPMNRSRKKKSEKTTPRLRIVK